MSDKPKSRMLSSLDSQLAMNALIIASEEINMEPRQNDSGAPINWNRIPRDEGESLQRSRHRQAARRELLEAAEAVEREWRKYETGAFADMGRPKIRLRAAIQKVRECDNA